MIFNRLQSLLSKCHIIENALKMTCDEHNNVHGFLHRELTSDRSMIFYSWGEHD